MSLRKVDLLIFTEYYDVVPNTVAVVHIDRMNLTIELAAIKFNQTRKHALRRQKIWRNYLLLSTAATGKFVFPFFDTIWNTPQNRNMQSPQLK